jgi:hypothetical protein
VTTSKAFFPQALWCSKKKVEKREEETNETNRIGESQPKTHKFICATQ